MTTETIQREYIYSINLGGSANQVTSANCAIQTNDRESPAGQLSRLKLDGAR